MVPDTFMSPGSVICGIGFRWTQMVLKSSLLALAESISPCPSYPMSRGRSRSYPPCMRAGGLGQHRARYPILSRLESIILDRHHAMTLPRIDHSLGSISLEAADELLAQMRGGDDGIDDEL